MGRSSELLAFATIFVVCLAGALKATWWMAVVGACVLMLVSLHNRWNRRGYAAAYARAVPDSVQVLASTINAGGVCAAAYVFGVAAAWAWGF